jgi:hypothetical protein
VWGLGRTQPWWLISKGTLEMASINWPHKECLHWIWIHQPILNISRCLLLFRFCVSLL